MEPVNSVNIQNMQPIECSICLDDVQENKVTLACKHIFHMPCLEQWREKVDNCPICRTVIRIIPNDPFEAELLLVIQSLHKLIEIASRYPNANNLTCLEDCSLNLLQFFDAVENLQLLDINPSHAHYQKRVEILNLSEFKTINPWIQETIHRIELRCELDWMSRANVIVTHNKIQCFLKKSWESILPKD